MAKLAILLLLLLLAVATVPAHGRDVPAEFQPMDSAAGGGDCVYTVYTRTSKIIAGGTDSKIMLQLAPANGNGVSISDLAGWGGIMGEGHNYFERGNLDIFNGRGPCIEKPCWMRLINDANSSQNAWYCNYVEVSVTGPHLPCTQQLFTVDQFLAKDQTPFQLETVRDLCGGAAAAA